MIHADADGTIPVYQPRDLSLTMLLVPLQALPVMAWLCLPVALVCGADSHTAVSPSVLRETVCGQFALIWVLGLCALFYLAGKWGARRNRRLDACLAPGDAATLAAVIDEDERWQAVAPLRPMQGGSLTDLLISVVSLFAVLLAVIDSALMSVLVGAEPWLWQPALVVTLLVLSVLRAANPDLRRSVTAQQAVAMPLFLLFALRLLLRIPLHTTPPWFAAAVAIAVLSAGLLLVVIRLNAKAVATAPGLLVFTNRRALVAALNGQPPIELGGGSPVRLVPRLTDELLVTTASDGRIRRWSLGSDRREVEAELARVGCLEAEPQAGGPMALLRVLHSAALGVALLVLVAMTAVTLSRLLGGTVVRQAVGLPTLTATFAAARAKTPLPDPGRLIATAQGRPDDAALQAVVAQVLELHGRREKALAAWQAVAHLAPGGTLHAAAEAGLQRITAGKPFTPPPAGAPSPPPN